MIRKPGRASPRRGNGDRTGADIDRGELNRIGPEADVDLEVSRSRTQGIQGPGQVADQPVGDVLGAGGNVGENIPTGLAGGDGEIAVGQVDDGAGQRPPGFRIANLSENPGLRRSLEDEYQRDQDHVISRCTRLAGRRWQRATQTANCHKPPLDCSLVAGTDVFLPPGSSYTAPS